MRRRPITLERYLGPNAWLVTAFQVCAFVAGIGVLGLVLAGLAWQASLQGWM